MIETKTFFHNYYKIEVCSLYSETRIPTDSMLENINTIVVDLQDVGTRVYTYITTLGLLMEKCALKNIKIIVLDRPNPVGCEIIEGNILEEEFKSFVGHHPIPMRHAMTIGEIAKFQNIILGTDCELVVVQMKNYKRSDFFIDTKLKWINPSPNLATMDSAISFCGTVLFEGTNVSEGRGTTRALEQIGAPKLDAFEFFDSIEKEFKENFEGISIRPVSFHPMFQKYANLTCSGLFIDITNNQHAKTWKLGQFLMKKFYFQNDFKFEFTKEPYEYEFEKLAIDLINGSSKVREWIIDKNSSLKELEILEQKHMNTFLKNRKRCLLY